MFVELISANKDLNKDQAFVFIGNLSIKNKIINYFQRFYRIYSKKHKILRKSSCLQRKSVKDIQKKY